MFTCVFTVELLLRWVLFAQLQHERDARMHFILPHLLFRPRRLCRAVGRTTSVGVVANMQERAS